MKKNEYLEGIENIHGIEYVLGAPVLKRTALTVFSDEACKFIAELSDEILKSQLIRQYPDLAALGFWGRRAHLKQLRNEFGSTAGRLGRGVCLHIAPSNIPINFAFSYLFALLAGDASIVRLPSKHFVQVEKLCELMGKLLDNHSAIKERSAFIRYERNDEITVALSKLVACRMIWGGDETVCKLKSMPTLPYCTDICFPDRYSILLINAKTVLKATPEALKRLAQSFYNDTYLMDQNACSSPQMILWLNDHEEARARFWQAVFSVAQTRYVLPDALAVDKFTKLCSDAIETLDLGEIKRYGNLLYRVQCKKISSDCEKLRGQGGYFYEYALKDMEELCDFVSSRFQTVTYFGLEAQKLQELFISHQVEGIDRIVPVGKALDISTVWDGHDLIRELSRVISFT